MSAGSCVKADILAFTVKYRSDDSDIWQMSSASKWTDKSAIRIEKPIARLTCLRQVRPQVVDSWSEGYAESAPRAPCCLSVLGHAEHSLLARRPAGMCQQNASSSVDGTTYAKECTAEIQSLFDIDRHTRFLQGQPHLLRNTHEAIRHN